MSSLRAFGLSLVLALAIGLGIGGVLNSGVAQDLINGSPASAALQAAPAPQAPAPQAQVPAPAATAGPVLDASGVVRQAGPAVVQIINRLSNGIASGSGFIIDDQGHIVTNNHVVDGERSLQVIFNDGRQAAAHLVGTDPANDIAVIQVDGAVPGTVQWGDSAQLLAGQPVVAIGSALGDFRNSVTVGVVSGLNRQIGGSGQTTGLIQTDAAINHGNSGGPLLNMNAEVIGVNALVVRDGSAGDQAEGLGFAIPANTAHTIADQLIQQGGSTGGSDGSGGSVARPYLGVSYQMLTPQIAAGLGTSLTAGAYLSTIQAGSPAEQAGLQAGDIITAIDGQPLDETHTLQSVLLAHQPGDQLNLSVVRESSNAAGTVSVTLGQR